MNPMCSLPHRWRPLALSLCAVLTGCAVDSGVYQPPYGTALPSAGYTEALSQEVVSVYADPPIMQPEPILVDWAPPPMLVETPPPMPFLDAIWIGGYWIWLDQWVWAAGRWAAPPRPHYHWTHPYYEHRGGRVVFIPGYWAPPGAFFAPPPPHASIRLVQAPPRIRPGPRPSGPPGVFVPPPPGSRPGLIVPAPVGTPPAVVTGAPPLIGPGMRVQPGGPERGGPQVTLVAPPGATNLGRPFTRAVPAQPHVAASQQPVVRALAPAPISREPVPSFDPGRRSAPLPPAQPLRGVLPAAPERIRPQPAPGLPGVQPAMPVPSVRPTEPMPPMPPARPAGPVIRERVMPPEPGMQRPSPPAPWPDARERSAPRSPSVQERPAPQPPAVMPREPSRPMPMSPGTRPDAGAIPAPAPAPRGPAAERRMPQREADRADERRPADARSSRPERQERPERGSRERAND